MTERTTDREAQREATATRSVAQRALQAQGDIASMYDEEIAGLRAAVTRLEGELESLTLSAKATYDAYKTAEGERDALRTALLGVTDGLEALIIALDRNLPAPSRPENVASREDALARIAPARAALGETQ